MSRFFILFLLFVSSANLSWANSTKEVDFTLVSNCYLADYLYSLKLVDRRYRVGQQGGEYIANYPIQDNFLPLYYNRSIELPKPAAQQIDPRFPNIAFKGWVISDAVMDIHDCVIQSDYPTGPRYSAGFKLIVNATKISFLPDVYEHLFENLPAFRRPAEKKDIEFDEEI